MAPWTPFSGGERVSVGPRCGAPGPEAHGVALFEVPQLLLMQKYILMARCTENIQKTQQNITSICIYMILYVCFTKSS